MIKAKLEGVTAGISTIETECLANIVLPNNTTAGERIVAPDRSGLPHLLPAAGNDASKSTGPIPLTPA